jgi:hypothetical protein
LLVLINIPLVSFLVVRGFFEVRLRCYKSTDNLAIRYIKVLENALDIALLAQLENTIYSITSNFYSKIKGASAQVNYLKFSIENSFDFVNNIKRRTNKLKIINKNNNKYLFVIRENIIVRKK